MYVCILMGVQIFIFLMHMEYLFLKHFDLIIRNHCFYQHPIASVTLKSDNCQNYDFFLSIADSDCSST